MDAQAGHGAGRSAFWSGYGRIISHPVVGCVVTIAVLALNIALILGSKMWSVALETDIDKLWVNPNTAIGEDLAYTKLWAQNAQGSNIELMTVRAGTAGTSVANPATLQTYYNLESEILDTVIRVNGTDYTTYDMCVGRAGLSPYVGGCDSYSVMDYFYEGHNFIPTQAMAQFVLDNNLAYSSGIQLLTWAAMAETMSPATAKFYQPLYQSECVDTNFLYCGEKDPWTVGSPYNSSWVGHGAGSVFASVDAVARTTSGLDASIVQEAAFIEAKGVLAGMMRDSANAPAVSPTWCPTWLDTTNSAVPGQPTWSLAPCAIQPHTSGTSCTGATCSSSALLTLKTNDFSSDCGKCVGAIMYWLGLWSGSGPVTSSNPAFNNSPPSVPAAGPLNTWAIYNNAQPTTAQAKTKQLFAEGSQSILCPATPSSVAKRVSLDGCIGMYQFSANARLQYAASPQNLQGFYNTFTGNFRYSFSLSPNSTTIPPIPNYSFSHDVLDVNQLLDSYNSGSPKSARDQAWRALVPSVQMEYVLKTFNRHYQRPHLASATTDDAVLRILSGVGNDFSILQNATRTLFGGTIPDVNQVQGGTCTCDSGYSGIQCNVPFNDGMCECGNAALAGIGQFPKSCITDVLFKCYPYAACAGYDNLAFIASSFGSTSGTMYYIACPNDAPQCVPGFTAQAQVITSVQNSAIALAQRYSSGSPSQADAMFYGQCEVFLPTFELTGTSPLSVQNATYFAPFVQDAGYVSAHALDLMGVSQSNPAVTFSARASFLGRMLFLVAYNTPFSPAVSNLTFDPAVFGPTNAAALASITVPSSSPVTLAAADWTTIVTCANVTSPSRYAGIVNCLKSTPLTTPTPSPIVSAACPYFQQVTGTSQLLKVFDFLQCYVDNTHGSSFIGNTKARTPVPTPSPAPVWPFTSTLRQSISNVSSALAATWGMASSSKCTQAYGGYIGMTLYELSVLRQTRISLMVSSTSPPPADLTVDYYPYLQSKRAWGVNLNGLNLGQANSNLAPTYLDQECTEMQSNMPAYYNGANVVNMSPMDCGQLLPNLAAYAENTALSTPYQLLSETFITYKAVGTGVGACASDALNKAVGGGVCWNSDVDCNGHGTCDNLANAVPLQYIDAFGFIMFSQTIEGITAGNNLNTIDAARYRALANEPILSAYYQANGITTQSANKGRYAISADDAASLFNAWHVATENIPGSSGVVNGTRVTYLSTGTTSAVVAQYSQPNFTLIVVGYFLMILYAIVSLTSVQFDVRKMMVESRGLVSASGIVLIAISVASGLGITHLAGYDWSAAATQILPYVMLGLGVNDVFVLCRTFPMFQPGMTARDATAEALGNVGNSIFLVNLTNSCIFSIAILTGMPVVTVMAAQASIITVANFVTVIGVLPFLLSVDYRRQAAGRADLVPCAPPLMTREQVASDKMVDVDKDDDIVVNRNCFNRFCVPTYTRLLLSRPGKFLALLLMFSMVVAGAVGVIAKSQLGLLLEDLAPSNSQLQESLHLQDTDFPFYTFYIAFPSTDYSPGAVQQEVSILATQVNSLSKVMANSGIAWTKAMLLWGLPNAPAYDLTTNQWVCDGNSTTTFGNCGQRFGCNISASRTDSSVWKAHNNPYFPPSDFYRCLNAWINNDGNYDQLSPGFVLTDPSAARGNRTAYTVTQNGVTTMPYSQIGFFAQGLNTNDDFVTLIDETTATTTAAASSANGGSTPITAYPGGQPIDYFDQYVTLRDVLNNAIGLGLLVCFFVVSALVFLTANKAGGRERVKKVFIVAVWTGAIVVVMVAMCVYELYGWMAYSNLKISAIPGISIIMSLGADLSFIAYVTTTFVNVKGTRDERVVKALDIMFAPSFDGGVTILLGVVLLAFSPLVFIVRYFFLVWVLIVVTALVNAYVILPALLAVLGPWSLHMDADETAQGQSLVVGDSYKAESTVKTP